MVSLAKLINTHPSKFDEPKFDELLYSLPRQARDARRFTGAKYLSDSNNWTQRASLKTVEQEVEEISRFKISSNLLAK